MQTPSNFPLPLLDKTLRTLKPTTLPFDFSLLSADVRAALPDLLEAVEIVSDIYRQQMGVSPDETEKLLREATPKSRIGFNIFKGPWIALADHEAFIDGYEKRPAQCGFYPKDLGKEEFEDYLGKHPSEKGALLSPYTVVKHSGDALQTIPFSAAYRPQIEKLASLLRKAAATVQDVNLKQVLTTRAAALLSDDYVEADKTWVAARDLPFEVVLGPYEVYDDGFMGVKTSFEAMLFHVDKSESARLKSIEAGLNAFAEAIPCPHGSRSSIGKMAPIVVVHELVAGGDGYTGILASAFNLPNDPVVRGAVGWKQVMIKNVMAAKFNTCTQAIAQKVLANGASDFDAYFMFVLMHEVAHGLGPAYRADGRSINEACAAHYSALEETKADIASMYLLQAFAGQHGLPKFNADTLGNSYLAGLFRSIRFGVHEAHGKANVIQYNWFKGEGVIVENAGKLSFVGERAFAATKGLLDKVCALQASGSQQDISAFLDSYGTPDAALLARVETLAAIPVDIIPLYPIYEELGHTAPFTAADFRE